MFTNFPTIHPTPYNLAQSEVVRGLIAQYRSMEEGSLERYNFHNTVLRDAVWNLYYPKPAYLPAGEEAEWLTAYILLGWVSLPQ